jgi:hypothetical protein
MLADRIRHWDKLIDIMLSAVGMAGEKETASDVYQQKMLCLDKNFNVTF